jgi:hypothetical protein
LLTSYLHPFVLRFVVLLCGEDWFQQALVGLVVDLAGVGLGGDLRLLGLEEGDGIGKSGGRAGAASLVVWAHDADLKTKHTLLEEDVADGLVNVLAGWVTGGDHEALRELHALGSLSPKLTRNNDFATLGTSLHSSAHDTVACTANSETTKEFVAEALSLSHGAETTLGDLLGEDLDFVGIEAETLADHTGELTDAAALVTEDILCAGSQDDDLGLVGDLADLDTSVTVLGELTSEELVQLGLEHTIGHKEALLAHLTSGHLAQVKRGLVSR